MNKVKSKYKVLFKPRMLIIKIKFNALFTFAININITLFMVNLY